MDHNQTPEREPELEFDLEDIVREFSDAPPLEEILREFASEKPQPPPVSTDTVRLDRIPTTLRADSTAGHTRRFAAVPADDTPEEIPEPQPQAPAVEPFSEAWEPEYEEPMGTYIPKEPIPFENRDRLRQLREQLVQHTERRYYALAEVGTASLRLSGFIIFLIFLLSAGATFALDRGVIHADRSKTVAFCQLLAILVAALLCHGRLVEGAAALVRGKFTLNAFLGISFAACCLDSIVCLWQDRISCGSLFCLQGAMAQWAAVLLRHREMLQMDTLRKASELTAVVKMPDYYEGTAGYTCTEGQLNTFLDRYRLPSAPLRALHIFTGIGVTLSVLMGIAVGICRSPADGIQTAAVMVLLTMPATAFISMPAPATRLEKQLHSLGTVLCGWEGVKNVDRQAVVPITHEDLFPKNAIGLNGMKFYGEQDPDMVVCYAGSLIAHEGGCLTPIFHHLMASRYIRHAAVEEFGSYPGGLSALVDGEPVAVGTLEFMRRMDVDVPGASQISNAVYVAVDGKLSGVFALRFSRSKAAAAGLRNVCSHGRATPVLVSRDFLLTNRFLRETLKVNTRRLIIPEPEIRAALAEHLPGEDAPVVALTVRRGLPQRTFAITGIWALRACQWGGAVIHILGGGLGLAAAAALSLIGATHLLTAANLLLYSLLWMIPGWLMTQWTRYV